VNFNERAAQSSSACFSVETMQVAWPCGNRKPEVRLSRAIVNDGLVHAVAGSAKLGVADALDVDLTLGPDLYENLLRSISQALVECLGD
jgi:hypothetical protein